MAGTGGSLVQRMIGASFLSVDTFEEVEHDESATLQAAGVVAMGAVAQALGGWAGGITSMVGGAVGAIVGWAVWAGLAYLIGTKLFEGQATWGQVLRTIGFAQAPGLLFVFGILPLTWMFLWVVPLWMMVSGFIGLRQALDIGNAKTLLTIVVGIVPLVLFRALFF